jgi:hypothetical protein
MATTSGKTLIVVHGNRYVEVFSNERRQCKIVNVPEFTTAEGELLIEELLTLRLPHHWSKVYRDGYLVDRDAIKPLTVCDLEKRDNDIALVKTMNRILNAEIVTVRI